MTSDQDLSFIAEALPVFISEAQEQIENLEQLLLELDGRPDDRGLLDALFRCAHTVKGSAGIFGLDRVVAFTHHVETLLDRVREGAVALTPSLSTLLLRCNDALRGLIAQAASGAADDAEAQATRQALVAALQAASGPDAGDAPTAAAAAPADSRRSWHVRVAFGADTFRNGTDPLTLLQYVHKLGELSRLQCETAAVPLLEALDPETCQLAFAFDLRSDSDRGDIEGAFSFVRDDCELHIDEPAACAPADVPADEPRPVEADREPATRAVAASAGAEEQRFIRVQASRLDEVINLLGELVIAGAGASLLARQTRHKPLMEAHLQISRLIEDVRNGTLQLRMVPIGETFSRFRRVVRDTAADLGKDVALDMLGGETELDKSVVERIADPLMHLVRNALDHGLETAEQRLSAGKPAQGRLTLSAWHESGSILIRIDDDGRGIQRQKVLRRAWDRGLLEDGVVPDDDAILRLIFEPGFSTAEQVTNLSGRGVGMDVVRRNIEALRGTVALSSEEGRGSRVEIRLPLTLAIIDGFLVGVGSSRFILPLDAVVEVIESRPTVSTLDASGRGVVELRGSVLPVVSLRRLYALDGAAPERSSVVVLRAGNRRFGVMVDQLLGQHQTVIKPLGRMFRSLRGMSGSSILGNGEVALIFDVNALGQLAADPPAHPAPRARTTSTEGQPS